MRVRIVFSDTKSWTPWAWAIKRYLGTQYYHTSFYLDFYDEMWESLTTGVKFSKREEWLKTHVIIKEFILDLSPERVNEIRTIAQGKLGTKYGYFQYVVILLNLSINNSWRQLICSEFDARIFAKELGYPEDTNFDKITPKDLYLRVKELYGNTSDLLRKLKGF